ncbi:MAG: hypothetical protein OSB62_08735 [Alphaproteobacteria bacterium]|nr:hypothetical protein [Alphaproteobacteria bacterium]
MRFSLKRTLLPLALGASLLLGACGESEKEKLQRELAELNEQISANVWILEEQNAEMGNFEIRKVAIMSSIAVAERFQAKLMASIAELEEREANLSGEQTAQLAELNASIESKATAVAALTTQVEQLNTQLAELQTMKAAEAEFFARAKVIAPSEENGAVTVHKFKLKAGKSTRTYVRIINWERELIIYHDRSDAAMVSISFKQLGGSPSASEHGWVEPTIQRFDAADFNTGQIIDWDTGVILDYSDDAGGDENSGLLLSTFADQPEAYQAHLTELEAELGVEIAKMAETNNSNQVQETETTSDSFPILAAFGFILLFFGIILGLFAGSPFGLLIAGFGVIMLISS